MYMYVKKGTFERVTIKCYKLLFKKQRQRFVTI